MVHGSASRDAAAAATIVWALTSLAGLAPFATLTAQSVSAPLLELTRLTGTVTIDGVPDEPAW